MVTLNIKFGDSVENVLGENINFILVDDTGNTVDGSNILVVNLINENINNAKQVLITLDSSMIDSTTFDKEGVFDYTITMDDGTTTDASAEISIFGSKDDISYNAEGNPFFTNFLSNIETIYIPYVVERIEPWTFTKDFSNLVNIYVDNIINASENEYLSNFRYVSRLGDGEPNENDNDDDNDSGILFGLIAESSDINNIDPSYSLLKYGMGRIHQVYKIPSDSDLDFSVKELGLGAFEENKYLEDITIANTVEKIGDYCFRKCEKLSSVEFDPSSNLKTLGKASFEACKKITNIELPIGLESIGEDAFAGCGFETIILPDSVTKINRNAFGTAVIEEFESSIESASSIDSSLTIVYLNIAQLAILNTYISPDSSEDWPKDYTDTNDTKIPPNNDINNNPIQLKWGPNNSFFGQSDVTISPSNSDNLLKITYNDNTIKYIIVTSDTIDSSLIDNSRNEITEVEYITLGLPTSIVVTTMGDSVFQGCTSLSTIDLPTTLATISSNAFQGCTSLESVTMPTDVTEILINDYAFKGCTAMVGITLPNNIEKIRTGKDVFAKDESNNTIKIIFNTTTTNGLQFVDNDNDNVYYTISSASGSIESKFGILTHELNEAVSFEFIEFSGTTNDWKKNKIEVANVSNIKFKMNPDNTDNTSTTLSQVTFNTLTSETTGIISGLTIKADNHINLDVDTSASLQIVNINLDSVTMKSRDALDRLLSKNTKKVLLVQVGMLVSTETANANANVYANVYVYDMENRDNDNDTVYGVVLQYNNATSLFKMLSTSGNARSIALPVNGFDQTSNIDNDITIFEEKSFQYANIEKLHITPNDKLVTIEKNAFRTLKEEGPSTYIFNPVLKEIHLTATSLSHINNNSNPIPNYSFTPFEQSVVLEFKDSNTVFGDSGEENQTLTLVNSGSQTEYGEDNKNALTLTLNYSIDYPNLVDDIILHIPLHGNNTNNTNNTITINKDTYTKFNSYGFKEGDISESNIVGVEIPSNVNLIDYEAFEDCVNINLLDFKSNYDEVNNDEVNNDGVTKLLNTMDIGSRAFKNCKKISTIKFPQNIGNINAYAFEKCTSLRSIILRNSILYIHETAFTNIIDATTNNEKVSIYTNDYINNKLNIMSDTNNDYYRDVVSFYGIPHDNTNIICLLNRRDLLLSNTYLSETTVKTHAYLAPHVIVEEFKSIGAFKGFPFLEKIELSKTLTSLGESTFSDCYTLKNVTLSKNITSFPKEVFYNCPQLNAIDQEDKNNIYKPDNTSDTSQDNTSQDNTSQSMPTEPYIGERAFSKSKLLDFTNFKMNNVVTIGEEAFEFCSGMTNITLPNTITHIAKDAFKNTKLVTIYIPKSVTSIGDNVFKNTLLEIVKIGDIDLFTNNLFPIGENKHFFGASEVTIQLVYDGSYYTTSSIENELQTDIRNDLNRLNSLVPPPSRLGIDEEKISIDINIVNITNIPDNLLNNTTIAIQDYSATATDTAADIANVTDTTETIIFDRNGFTNITLGIIDIPDVTHIGKRAFYSNDTMKLKDNRLPPNLIVVGDEAFENCKALEVDNINDLRNKAGKTEGHQAFKDTPVANDKSTSIKLKSSNSLIQLNTLMRANRKVTRRSNKPMNFV